MAQIWAWQDPQPPSLETVILMEPQAIFWGSRMGFGALFNKNGWAWMGFGMPVNEGWVSVGIRFEMSNIAPNGWKVQWLKLYDFSLFTRNDDGE